MAKTRAFHQYTDQNVLTVGFDPSMGVPFGAVVPEPPTYFVVAFAVVMRCWRKRQYLRAPAKRVRWAARKRS